MGIVEEFEEFKLQLREKWLDYCEANEQYLNVWYKNCTYPDNDFIVGVLTIIEPNLVQWIHFYLTHIQPLHPVSLSINFLKLDFDYKNALETRKEERAKNQLIEPPSLLDDFRKQIKESSNIEN
jgi:hypothetical protein